MQESNSIDENKQSNSRNTTPKKKNDVYMKSPTPKKPIIKINFTKSLNTISENKEKEDKHDKHINNIDNIDNIDNSDKHLNKKINKLNESSINIERTITEEENKKNTIAPIKSGIVIKDIDIDNGIIKQEDDNFTFDEKDNDNEENTKKKKDWISWSLNEKLLFYEAIANGANYSSLQKLFKNMNDVF
jgi:hypothetical protein